ncbi:hypothetical protein AALP_AA7G198300 [Arabis alpina]|uniref:Phorbol-ester/DAG-type domain-containing protein n=1 Tax=Arabis alpina TaxID=50452 RepID=A0A087GJ91_ARAAL|nr:hypothetical protein AALP_AA7G198300 [Arabis alpina]
MALSPVKLATYKHPLIPSYKNPLIPSARLLSSPCEGCNLDGLIYGGYYYSDVDRIDWYHKECVEAPLTINHPSHPQHPLLLGKPNLDLASPCDLCGFLYLASREMSYTCSQCNFNLDLACALRLSPPAEHPTCHDHPLVLLKEREKVDPCELCKDSIDGFSYSCLECDVHFHAKCVHLSKEVNHPCHTDHPLKLMASDSLSNDAEKICILCGKRPENMLYHCSICNFTTCFDCTKNPPPLVIDHTKTHKHPLTLFPKKISCACNLCGKQDGVMPYACIGCGFVVHGSCIDLPRVININRHNHRISSTHHLGPGYLKCGVCRESLSPFYGAYACSVCPDYAVHSQCATRKDVWDGIELEGIPEDTEDIEPFKAVGDDLIIHFLHSEHALRHHKESIIHSEGARCKACVHPVGFDPIYSCGECHYILHEKCANLPKKKRLVFGTVPYVLRGGLGSYGEVLICHHCEIYSNGYLYSSIRGSFLDVHCASLSEPFIHDGHPHPLYFSENTGNHHCDACHSDIVNFMLSCDVCEFYMGLCCAGLPVKIKHSIDEHPLTLCCGEKANGRYWCDICEKVVDPSKWFYTCSDCGLTLHLKCVVGDFSRIMPGRKAKIPRFRIGGDDIVKVVLNNHNTRPLCSCCNFRCEADVIIKFCHGDQGYICSRLCLMGSLDQRKLR